MAYGRTIRREGSYNRLAEPSWADPLDAAYSARDGGRWNPPGGFGVLYLNRDVRVARLQVLHKLRGQPYAVEDLDEAEQHDLVSVEIAARNWLDCVTDSGLEVVGLPVTYPRHPNNRGVRHATCQQVGQAAFDDGKPGVACRSAAIDALQTDEELAIFDREVSSSVRMSGRQSFADWFWDSTS
jgi:RES domain-containing protein